MGEPLVSGYIPDPEKGILDYLTTPQHNAFRVPVGIIKFIVGTLTILLVPFCLAIYLILIIFARRFMFAQIPELMGELWRFVEKCYVTGYSDIFYRLNRYN